MSLLGNSETAEEKADKEQRQTKDKHSPGDKTSLADTDEAIEQQQDKGEVKEDQEIVNDLPERPRKQPWEDDSFGGKVPVRELVSAFGVHIIKYKKTLFRALTAFFVGSTLQSMIPLSNKFIIDYLFPSRNFWLLLITAGALITIYLLKNVINILGGHLLIHTSLHIVFDVRRRLFEHLQLLHLAFYEREQSGKLVAKLINDAAALQILIQQALPVLSVNVFTIMVTFILMFTISTKLTLFALLAIPSYLFIDWIFRYRLYRTAKEVRERNSVVAGNVNEVITGIKVVKSFGMEDKEHKRFVNMMRENLNYEIDLGSISLFRAHSLELTMGAAHAGILLLGGIAVMSPEPTMSVGDYVAFFGFMWMLYNPMLQIAALAIQCIHARTGLERILHILNIKPKVMDRPDAKVVDRLNGNVHLDNVCFSYSDDGEEVLSNINIEAHPGEIVALVGPSGSGKSTIVNLLTRFYDVTGGQILIDGTDIRDLKLQSYQRRVGIVLQEPFLFSGTIRDNICYGAGRSTYEEVNEAARQANALEFIEKLPEGMKTQVGERGQLLSGGQRQRISIARALLKDPDILILDEATSALDTQSERLVQEALDRLMRGRTVFVVAHRLTTIKNATKIIVLDKGCIVEQGNHQTLIEQDGLYASLYSQHLSNELGGEFGSGEEDNGNDNEEPLNNDDVL